MIPTIEIDLSQVTQPQPRTVGEVPVGHRFTVGGITYLRIGGTNIDKACLVVQCCQGWAHMYLHPDHTCGEYLGPADGKAAAAGEEVQAKDLSPLDVVLLHGQQCVCLGNELDGCNIVFRLRCVSAPETGWDLKPCDPVRRIARLAFKTGDSNGK